jgi:hypothetical protein
MRIPLKQGMCLCDAHDEMPILMKYCKFRGIFPDVLVLNENIPSSNTFIDRKRTSRHILTEEKSD